MLAARPSSRWAILILLIAITVLLSCAAYQIEPDWQTGEECWRYGVIAEHPPKVDPLTIPVLRLRDKEVANICSNLRGCYVDIDAPYIVLPGPLYAGQFEETHERCHAFGKRHCGGLQAFTGAYATRRSDCI